MSRTNFCTVKSVE